MKTRKQRIAALRRIYDGVETENLYDMIANDVKELRIVLKIKEPRRQKKAAALRYVTESDYRTIQKYIPIALKRKHSQLITSMAMELEYHSGVRISETVNMRIEDINLEERFIRVLGKGKKERLVVISQDFAVKLRTYILALPNAQKHLFEKTSGGRPAGKYTTRNIAENLKKVRDMASEGEGKDFGYITAHALRHTHLQNLLAGDADITVAQKQAGHSNPATTSNQYANNPILQRKLFDKAVNNLRQTNSSILT